MSPIHDRDKDRDPERSDSERDKSLDSSPAILHRTRTAQQAAGPSNLGNTVSSTAQASGNEIHSSTSSINYNTPKSNPGSKRKKRPAIQKTPSYNFVPNQSKYVYSVDDDADELELDFEREYLEGFNDAMKYRYKKSSKNLKDANKEELQTLTNEVIANLINADMSLKKLEGRESDPHRHHPLIGEDNHLTPRASRLASSVRVEQVSNFDEDDESRTITPRISGLHHNTDNDQNYIHNIKFGNELGETNRSEDDANENDDDADDHGRRDGDFDDDEDYDDDHHHHNNEGDNHDDDDDDDNDNDDDKHSISSMESFTLRSRQDAINETHPFGIRIWKPALYKKVRSVQREADKDIHDSGAIRNKIGWEVYSTNFIWSFTIGLVFFILCMLGSSLMILCGSTSYAKVLFYLGQYLMFPFGKVVYLMKDKNYLSEDRNEGTTVREYERWRDEEHNKLFFSSSFTNQANGNAGNGTSSDAPMTPSIQPIASENLANSQRLHPLRTMDRSLDLSSVQENDNEENEEEEDDDDDDHKKKRYFGRGDWTLGRIVFYLYFYLVLGPILLSVWLISWLLVLTIPMAKVVQTLSDHLRRHPLAIFYKYDSMLPSERVKDSNILVCTYRSCGLHYYKYTVEGTNIFFINLMAVVIFTIIDFFFIKEYLEWEGVITDESVIFALCLFSIIPLAYFIGQAVASISAQSSMGVGAVINAFFSTVVEVFLYCVALSQKKGSLVEGSLIGSILAAVLLLPGLSMCAGAFIRKTQRYNPASASVSCTMLLFSLCVMFAPTVFHQIYGTYEIKCKPCPKSSLEAFTSASCQTCQFIQPPLQIDHFFKTVLKPFSVVCAILLLLAYTIGLWFTLRTHAALIWQTPISDSKPKMITTPSVENVHQQAHINAAAAHLTAANATAAQPAPAAQPAESSGHDSPNWSRSKSTIVLLGATLLYAVIAEILVDCVDSVLANFPINPKFLGITIFALVPNTTEFLNAISFATHGNVALSMEIGSAYALQVCLIQIPSLVLYSLFFINPGESNLWNIKDKMFTLIFPNWDVVATVVSVVLFTYIYAEGKSNYFKGSILILIYCIVMIGFYFTGVIESDRAVFSSSFTIMADSS